MPVVELTNLRETKDSREGLRFTALRKAESHEFLISREALSDLVKGDTRTEAEMRAAFEANADRIKIKVQNVLDYQYRAPEDGFILLQTNDFQ